MDRGILAGFVMSVLSEVRASWCPVVWLGQMGRRSKKVNIKTTTM